ncbi:MAG: hypothetical protein ABJB05_10665 [Parafilimonas sp.]
METIVVQPSSNEEVIMLKEFLKQKNIKNRIINEDDKDDFVLSLLMQQTDYNDIVDTNKFLKQLQGK